MSRWCCHGYSVLCLVSWNERRKLNVITVLCEADILKQQETLLSWQYLVIQGSNKTKLVGLHKVNHYGIVTWLLLSARTAMWSMPVVLTEWENENDSQNQWESLRMTSWRPFCKMTSWQNDVAVARRADSFNLRLTIHLTDILHWSSKKHY